MELENIGDYKLIKEMGRGSWGVTYLVEKQEFDVNTGNTQNKQYVMKFMNSTSFTFKQINDMIDLAKKLTDISKEPESENYMIDYHDVFTIDVNDKNYVAVITSYIDGYNLSTFMARNKTIDFNTALFIIQQVLESLNYLHMYNISHRNIKPENVLFDPSLNRWKLIDYEFSCTKSYIQLCSRDKYDTYYQAPELLKEKINKTVSFDIYLKSDIWSLGIVFYKLVNKGKYIFETTDKEVKKDLLLLEGGNKHINPSDYVYKPINSIIDVMLRVVPTSRPNTSELIVLLYLARPMCKVDNINYDRNTIQAMLYGYGIDTHEWNDYELCSKLTNEIQLCKVLEHKYAKEDLTRFSKMLNIEGAEQLNIKELCNIINKKVTQQQYLIKRFATEHVIRALSYVAFSKLNEIESRFKDDAYERLQANYDKEKNIAFENDLLDIPLLEAYRKNMYNEYHNIANNASVNYARVFAIQNNMLIDLICMRSPNYLVNGRPIVEYKL